MEHNERQFKLAVLSPASVSDPVPLSHVSARGLAVGETVILLHPPLPLARGFHRDGEREPQQDDGPGNG